MVRKGKNKRRKAEAAVGIVLLLLLGSSFWGGREAIGQRQEFRMWTAPDRQLNVAIEGDVLHLAGRGLEPEDGILWMRVAGEDGVEQEEFSRGSGGSYAMSVPLSQSIERGRTYYVEAYLGKEEYGEFRGFLFREASFQSKKGDGKECSFTFPASEKYRENIKWLEGEKPPEVGSGGNCFHQTENPQFRSLAMRICAGKLTDYEKAQAIHDWVTSQICYDEDEARKDDAAKEQSAHVVLQRGRAVCEGYARLVAELARAAGLPCKIIYGRGTAPEAGAELSADETDEALPNHAWNEIWANGRWVIVDTTWDAAGIYRNGSYLRNGSRGRTYFDISPEAFSATHRIMGDLDELEVP